jgi:hypothetical protein
MPLRSIIKRPSPTHEPEVLCAPLRTVMPSPEARANRIASLTSEASAQRAITAGRRSTLAFQTFLASS